MIKKFKALMTLLGIDGAFYILIKTRTMAEWRKEIDSHDVHGLYYKK